jgi:hypothetical protein
MNEMVKDFNLRINILNKDFKTRKMEDDDRLINMVDQINKMFVKKSEEFNFIESFCKKNEAESIKLRREFDNYILEN